MADYSADFNDTASATLGSAEVDADATRPRRLELLEWDFGSEATAADNPFLWVLERVTAPGAVAGDVVTLNPLDVAEAATEADGLENLTTNPSLGARLLGIPLNQRASYRWVAQPGVPVIAPAIAGNGFIIRTPTSAAVVITSSLVVREH
jgi:hypothetical protein